MDMIYGKNSTMKNTKTMEKVDTSDFLMMIIRWVTNILSITLIWMGQLNTYIAPFARFYIFHVYYFCHFCSLLKSFVHDLYVTWQ